MAFEIEKNIKVPPVSHSGGRKAKYPFAELESGDSFLVVGEKPQLVQQAAAAYGRRHGVKFETRRCEGGVRVWKK